MAIKVWMASFDTTVQIPTASPREDSFFMTRTPASASEPAGMDQNTGCTMWWEGTHLLIIGPSGGSIVPASKVNCARVEMTGGELVTDAPTPESVSAPEDSTPRRPRTPKQLAHDAKFGALARARANGDSPRST